MTLAGLVEHIQAFLNADPETSIMFELREVFCEIPSNKPREEEQISMMKPKALVWLLQRVLRHLTQDKVSASETECLSRCAQDNLLFGRWSAIHLLDDEVLAFTGAFQVGGIPSRGASSGLGLRLHLAQRLDNIERLVNCFSGGDEVGFPVVFHGNKLGVGEDEWCLEVQLALGEIPLHVSLDLGTPLFDLPVNCGVFLSALSHLRSPEATGCPELRAWILA